MYITRRSLRPLLSIPITFIDGTRLGSHLVITYFIMDGIHPNYGTNLVQGAVAPGFNLVPHLHGDVTYGYIGNPYERLLPYQTRACQH